MAQSSPQRFYRLHDICSGGVQQRVDDLLSKNNEVWDIKNASIQKIGNIVSQKTNSTHTSGSQFDGIYELVKSSGRTLFRANSGNLQSYSGGSWSTVTGGSSAFTSGVYVDFAPLILVSGTTLTENIIATGVDALKKVVVSTGSATSNIQYAATTFYMYGTCVATIGNIAFVGGVKWIDSTPTTYNYSNRIYISKPGTLEFWNSTETSAVTASTRYIEVTGSVRAMAVVNKYLVVFSDNVTIVNPSTFEQFVLSDYSCVNAGSVAIGNDAIAWISLEGIFVWQGTGRPVKISRSISTVNGDGYWDYVQLDENSKFRAFVADDSFLFYVVANEGDTDFDEVLEYDWAAKAWKRDTGYAVKCSTRSLQSNKIVTFIGNADGGYLFRQGTTYGSLVFETKNIYLDSIDRVRTIDRIYILYKATTDYLKVEYTTDEDTDNWLTLTEHGSSNMVLNETDGKQILGRIDIGGIQCSSIRFKFSCSDSATYVDISGIVLEYRGDKSSAKGYNITSN